MPAPFSMSALERAMTCAPSTRLPQRLEVYEHALAMRGTIIHDFLADVLHRGYQAALARAPAEWRERLEAIEVDRLPSSQPELYQGEVELAYNPIEDRALVMVRGDDGKFAWNGERGELGPEWIPGRPDVFAVLPDRVVVLDFKTGWKRFGPIKKVPQLLGYAVALARFFGKSLATVGIVRIREDGSCWYDQDDVSAMELDLAALRIREALVRSQDAAAATLPVVEGAHCRYCPAFEHCEAKQKLLRDAARALTDAEIEAQVRKDPVAAVEWIKRARQLADRVEERAGELAREIGGIDLPDGTAFGPRPYGLTKIDVAKAVPVIRERFGDQVAKDAVKFSVSQGSLKAALQDYKKRTPGARIGELEKNAMQALREAGAATLSVTHPVGVYDREQVAKLIERIAAENAARAPELPAAPAPSTASKPDTKQKSEPPTAAIEIPY